MGRMNTLLVPGKEIDLVMETYKGAAIYGVSWTKADVALVRTNASVDMVAAAGVDAGVVTNNFDTAEIFSEFTEWTDADGNVFVKIPKFYIRKTDIAGRKTWQICKQRLPGSYVPWCFINFTTDAELDFVYVGKYVAGNNGTKLTSVANVYPTINQNIVTFRTWAENNGAKYQQLDIHVYDMLQVLFTVEFATLDSQSVMTGWTSGTSNKQATVAESGVNRIIVANADADAFAVGQPIGLGSSNYGNQIAYGRNITSIDVYDASNKAISFDGATVNISIGNYVYNVGWKSGFSSGISASSGSLANNTNGKNPFHYRGIENLWGNVWQFVDGININEWRAWVCKDASQYVSNLFASPYEQLAYLNSNTNGYVKYLGHDPVLPFTNFPIDVSANYYRDYYYQSSGQRIAIVGGHWHYGGYAGLWTWLLNNSSAVTYVNLGGRLLKKAL